MNHYPESALPAAKEHMQAQVSFFNAIAKTLFDTAQHYNDLNLQLGQTLLEEGTRAGQQVLASRRPTEAFAAAMEHAQPVAAKLRAYQQHLALLNADTQVDLADVAERHVPETSRAAEHLAEEVKRASDEEMAETTRRRQEAVNQFTDPFQDLADEFHSRHADTAAREGARHQQGAHPNAAGQAGKHTRAPTWASAGRPAPAPPCRIGLAGRAQRLPARLKDHQLLCDVTWSDFLSAARRSGQAPRVYLEQRR